MADNASITILRNTQANINAEPIKDGNILFTTDQPSNEIYADVGAKRIKIGGGKGISNISKTGTSGLVDTYTITYSDGTTSTFKITNGKDSALSTLIPLRQTSANVGPYNDGKIKLFLSSSSMTEGKPSSDGYILNFAWDGGNDATQLSIPADPCKGLEYRIRMPNGWREWKRIYSEDFKPTLDDIGIPVITNKEIDTIVG